MHYCNTSSLYSNVHKLFVLEMTYIANLLTG